MKLIKIALIAPASLAMLCTCCLFALLFSFTMIDGGSFTDFLGFILIVTLVAFFGLIVFIFPFLHFIYKRFLKTERYIIFPFISAIWGYVAFVFFLVLITGEIELLYEYTPLSDRGLSMIAIAMGAVWGSLLIYFYKKKKTEID